MAGLITRYCAVTEWYNTLCQPFSSLWVIIFLLFKFGWLNLLRDPRFNQAGSSFMALQFIALKFVISSCLRSTDIEWSLDKSCVLHNCFVYLSTFIWTLSRMWNARIPRCCLLFTFLLPNWKDSKGKETPCEHVGTHLWVDRFFWINTENALNRD